MNTNQNMHCIWMHFDGLNVTLIYLKVVRVWKLSPRQNSVTIPLNLIQKTWLGETQCFHLYVPFSYKGYGTNTRLQICRRAATNASPVLCFRCCCYLLPLHEIRSSFHLFTLQYHPTHAWRSFAKGKWYLVRDSTYGWYLVYSEVTSVAFYEYWFECNRLRHTKPMSLCQTNTWMKQTRCLKVIF